MPWPVSLWRSNIMIPTNQSTVSGGIWTNERSPLCLQHGSPLSTDGEAVAGVLHVAASDGAGGGLVGAEDGGPHLELAVGGVGVQPRLQTGLAQRLKIS